MSGSAQPFPAGNRTIRVLQSIFVHTWLALAGLLVLLPVLWMVVASFTPGKLLSGVKLIPDLGSLTLEHYQYLFTFKSDSDAALPDFVAAFLRSLEVALLNTLLVVLLSTLSAYVFSRFRFAGRKPILLILLLLQMFPSFMGMLALFMIFRNFGWLNQPLYFVTFYVASAVPYNIYLIRGFMRNIPRSLDEAARIDGASNMTVFFRIIMPLTLPMLGFVAVNAFMQPWFDFMLPSQLVSRQNETVALTVYRMTDPYNTMTYNPLNFMAASLSLTIPFVLVNLYTQRFIIYGLAAGADKG